MKMISGHEGYWAKKVLSIGADEDEFVVLMRLEGPFRINQCSTLMLYGQNG
jgi:hypothetical protein